MLYHSSEIPRAADRRRQDHLFQIKIVSIRRSFQFWKIKYYKPDIQNSLDENKEENCPSG